MTIYHVHIDLDYLIHRGGARVMAGYVRLPGAENWATEAEVIAYAALLKMRGMEAMPTCANHDARGLCNGHKEPQP